MILPRALVRSHVFFTAGHSTSAPWPAEAPTATSRESVPLSCRPRGPECVLSCWGLGQQPMSIINSLNKHLLVPY